MSASVSSTNVKHKGLNGSRIFSSDPSRQDHCKIFIFHLMFLSYSARSSVQSLVTAPLSSTNVKDKGSNESRISSSGKSRQHDFKIFVFYLKFLSSCAKSCVSTSSPTNVKHKRSYGSRISASCKSRQHHCKIFIFYFSSFSFCVRSCVKTALVQKALNTKNQMDPEYLHLEKRQHHSKISSFT